MIGAALSCRSEERCEGSRTIRLAFETMTWRQHGNGMKERWPQTLEQWWDRIPERRLAWIPLQFSQPRVLSLCVSLSFITASSLSRWQSQMPSSEDAHLSSNPHLATLSSIKLPCAPISSSHLHCKQWKDLSHEADMKQSNSRKYLDRFLPTEALYNIVMLNTL